MKGKFSVLDWVEVKGEPGAKYQVRDVQHNEASNQIVCICHAQFPENHPEWPSMTDRMVGFLEAGLKKVG